MARYRNFLMKLELETFDGDDGDDDGDDSIL